MCIETSDDKISVMIRIYCKMRIYEDGSSVKDTLMVGNQVLVCGLHDTGFYIIGIWDYRYIL